MLHKVRAVEIIVPQDNYITSLFCNFPLVYLLRDHIIVHISPGAVNDPGL